MTIKQAEHIINDFNEWINGLDGDYPDFTKVAAARRLLIQDLENKAEIRRALEMLKFYCEQQRKVITRHTPSQDSVIVLHPKEITWAMEVVIAELEKNLQTSW